MLSSMMAWLLSSSLQKPIIRSETITKRELVAIVTAAATTFIFCPEPLRPFRDIGVVVFLAWLAHILYGVWESIPTWLIDVVNHSCAWNGNLQDQDSWTLEIATEQLSEAVSRIRAATVGLWHLIRAALLKTLQAMEFLESPQEEDKDPPPAPQPTQWYGILVRAPAVHEYGPISDQLYRRTITAEAIPWGSYSTACIPGMVPSLNFRTHLAFCLVQKTVWESRNLTLFQKMKSGSYWDIHGQNIRHKCASWTEAGVREIISIESLGLVDAEGDPIDMCQEYFALLYEDWTYMNIWWNDVDFALLLGFLVVGHRAAAKCKSILEGFRQLRDEEVVKPRSEGCTKGFIASWGVGMLSAVVTIASGGIAAPATGPLFMTACATAMGCGIAATAISEGERMKMCRRVRACHNLVGRFPQLRAIFDRNME